MKIPVFQLGKAVDKEGNFAPFMQQFFDLFFQQMQKTLSDDGFEIPQLTTQQISNVTSASNHNAKGNGTIWYDSDANQFKGYVNGVVKVFTLT